MSLSVSSLAKALQQAAAQPPKKKKKSKKAKAKRAAQGASGGNPQPGPSAARTNRVQRPLEWVMSHREYLGQITLGSDGKLSGSISLIPASLPWLQHVSKCFEMYKWSSLAIEYIPDVGTTVDGSIALGVDWVTKNVSKVKDFAGREVVGVGESYTRDDVVQLTPALVTPFWRPATMRLPVAELQTRKWYVLGSSVTDMTDYGPGTLAYYANGPKDKVCGDLWVSYKLVLAGTKKAT